MKTVKQILESKPSYFNVVTPDTTVLDALRVMKNENLSYVIVMDEEKYQGVMSEKDYSRKVILEGKDSTNTCVKEIMEDDMLPFIDINDTSDKCLAMMNTFKARYLPVLDDQHFRGVITLHDIMRIILAEKISTNSLNFFNDDY
ncbi:MAG: CBS domain-containing protein [Bacteroidetes bacterium]|nr:CBS domain-containing protein [Bacteroidota bacterium]